MGHHHCKDSKWPLWDPLNKMLSNIKTIKAFITLNGHIWWLLNDHICMTTLRRRQLHHWRISLELSAVLLFICNAVISVVVIILILLTYLLNPLRAEVHIRLTPEHATAVYLLMFSRVSPGQVIIFHLSLFFSRFLSVFLSPVVHLMSIWEQFRLSLPAAFSRRGQCTAI